MNKLLAAISLVVLSGCAQISGLIPSFWDDNQSAKITDLRQDIRAVDCAQAQAPQVRKILRDLEWFRLYSESKGHRQQDVLRLTAPMQETAADWYKRVSAEGYKENATYCRLKVQVMTGQAERAARAVLGRF